jgi:glycosyltransferase involved in cell wall biosynthesis
LRVLHAPRNIANQAGYLVTALRRLGHDAELWEYGSNAFGFPVDRTIEVRPHNSTVYWDTFQAAIDRFDVFHFHFGRSLFPNQSGGVPAFWDLPVYRARGKRVFFTFHGSDCRIRRIHEDVNPWSYFRYSDIAADDDRTAKTIEIIRTYADRMFVVSADYLAFVPEATVLPRVIDLASWPAQQPDQRRVPRIVHMPSARGTKGTSLLLDGIAELRQAGVEFDFRLVEGVSHDQARAAIADADVVVDNVLTGDYELVSIEAMASSRVAVANIQSVALDAHPDAPVYSIDPTTIVSRLRALIDDAPLRRQLAAAGRAYVAGVHDAPLIARQLVDHYEAPPRKSSRRSFPGWASLDDARKIERLEERVATLEQRVARAGAESAMLRRRLGLNATPQQRAWKQLVPPPLRHVLRRVRASMRQIRGRPR